MAAKLHALLAVEEKLKTTANKLTDESIRTFNKEQLFKGHTKRLTMFGDDESNSAMEEEGYEHKELTTTVDENLKYLFTSLARYWDAVYQKEATNQRAKADLVVNGKTLAKDVPATFLLGMEAKLRKLRDVLSAIHTLPPGIRWEKADDIKKGVYRAADKAVTMKTKREPKFEVITEATEHHPAQYEKVEVTSNVGKYETTNLCALLTPAELADRMKRLDDLIEGVVMARSKANGTEVNTDKIAYNMLDFVMTGNAPSA